MKKIRVAFLIPDTKDWIGGLNYLKNLLFAISKLDISDLEILIFVGGKVDFEYKEVLKNFGEIYESSILDKKSFFWFVRVFTKMVFRKDYLLSRFLKKHDVDVLSHSNLCGAGYPFKVINWIPDFQHFFLKSMFTNRDINNRNKTFKKILRDSDAVLLSSHASYNDLVKNYSCHEIVSPVFVLNFVSQPHVNINKLPEVEYLYSKYNIPKKFFYLPNQFWKHKNHTVVFKAVKILKENGVNINLVCTGSRSDYRDKHYFFEISNYLKENNLEKNIFELGVIDFEDVIMLMRYSISVINPSFFEGWSSTVEECKSLGKRMVLSNIDVHIEQSPLNSEYFDPSDDIQLADILKKQWFDEDKIPDFELENFALKNLERRTLEFGKNYRDIVLNVLNHK